MYVEGIEWTSVEQLPERRQKADLIFDGFMHLYDTTVAFGMIYRDSGYPGDGFARWEDGTPIRTSSITNMCEMRGQFYIVTRNTIYRVIGRTLKLSKEDV